MADLFTTVRHLLLLNGRLQEIQLAMNGFLGQYAHRVEDLKKNLLETIEGNSILEQYEKRLTELKGSLLESFEESEFYNEHIKSMLLRNRFQSNRIVRAFPKLRSLKYDDALQKLKSVVRNRNK